MNGTCCCVELTVTEDAEVLLSVAEDSHVGLDVEEQFVTGGGITPSGTKEISVTQNGTTNTDVTYYANAKVVANVSNSYAASDEGKVVQDGDLESQTTATFEANDTYDTTTIKQVTVDVPASAVDSGYVHINENDTVDVVGYAQAVVNVPASAVDSGTKSISVTANGTTTHDVVGYASASVTANVPNTYAAGDEGKVVDNGALVSQGSATYTINSTYDTTKIKSVTVNVSGGGSPTLQTKSVSYTPSESQQTAQVTADEGYDALQEVDVTVGAISSTYVGSGIDRNDSTDLTASGATVTAPAGYYEESASKAVAAGTAGTPVATKGEVSNHSVSVTPSVTNSAGYIASETKTGTAVTVTAAELESGTKTITANGNNQDVVGYAAVNVNVPNTYSAADEGKVVSSGALVSQTSDTVTQNGTVDTTLINSLTVNVSGGGGNLGGLANMVNVNTQQYQFAYMLMCMKNGDTKGGTATWTTAFPNTDTKIIETGLTTIHGFMLVNVERDYHINNGNNQTQDILYVFVNTDDTYNAFGCTAQATGSMATVINLTQGANSNSAPLNGAFTFNGGDIYYKGRYNQNASYQIVKTNMQYEWLAW